MIRLFKVYYPLRTLVLLAGEAMIVWVSFLLATMLAQSRQLAAAQCRRRVCKSGGYCPKILVVTGAVLLLSHWLDLYDSSSLGAKWEQVFRILLVLGSVALALAAVGFLFPALLPGNGSALFWESSSSPSLFFAGVGLLMDGQTAISARAGLRAGHRGTRASGWSTGLRERSDAGR